MKMGKNRILLSVKSAISILIMKRLLNDIFLFMLRTNRTSAMSVIEASQGKRLLTNINLFIVELSLTLVLHVTEVSV